MAKDELFSGESKNIEYKVVVPDKSEKYMKTVVAFANTQGGRLVIGIDDKTHQVVGVDNDSLFQAMDALTNAISDSCEPQIIPDIGPQTVDGKTVIVITVEAGKNRPYYIKAQGKAKGTYIRVAGTSRHAHQEKISELEMEGARISWDELTCVGYEVTEEATQSLCKDIEDFRKKAGLSGHDVRKEQLFNWKILKKSEGNVLASNAYVLLTSDYFPFAKTQCAVFKGTDRTVFLDKREYTGPIYKQIESAVDFVLRNIRLGMTIDGLVRRESYELPVEAIREMIINAHCHRNLLDESCIQVAIYDDRLEITSPGGLLPGVTIELMKEGFSKIRNRSLANAFAYMNLVEAWGSGIPKLMQAMQEYGLREPEFIDMEVAFRINLYRGQNEVIEVKNRDHDLNHGSNDLNRELDDLNHEPVDLDRDSNDPNHDPKDDLEIQLSEMIYKNPELTQKELAKALAVSTATIKRMLTKMQHEGKVIREGSNRKGKWILTDKMK